MTDWWTYAPQDFLLFAPATYWRLFALNNAALWPLPLVAPVLAAAGFAAVVAEGRVPVGVARAGWVVLAAGAVLVSEVFLKLRYEPINWAIAAVRPAFLAEAVLLALLGATASGGVAGGVRRGGGLLLGAGAIAYPLVGIVAGRPLAEAEVVGLAPDPTAAAMLGLALLARRPAVAATLAAIPALWLLASAATLLTMGEATGWVPVGAVAVALLAAAASAANRRDGGR